MKLEFSRLIFEKSSNIKVHENLSSGYRVPCGGRETDEQDAHSNMTKLLVAFRTFANATKNVTS